MISRIAAFYYKRYSLSTRNITKQAKKQKCVLNTVGEVAKRNLNKDFFWTY